MGYVNSTSAENSPTGPGNGGNKPGTRLKARKPAEPNPYVNPGEIPVFLQQRLEHTEKRLAQARAKAD